MQYLKLKSGKTIIELHNNWLGEETVIVGGQIVSKKSSVYGTQHYFTIHEDDEPVNYVLITKIMDNMMIGVDLIRKGKLIYENVTLPYGSKPKTPAHDLKTKGLALLKNYDIHGAMEVLLQAIELDPNDPEIYFHLACVYSNLEDVSKGYEYLQKAVESGLTNHESILNHDMLAFLRIQKEFEKFQQEGFKLVKKKKSKN